MNPRLCKTCQQRTYPEKWCECDPREQLSDFFGEQCVILMAEEGSPPPEDFGPAYAEALLR